MYFVKFEKLTNPYTYDMILIQLLYSKNFIVGGKNKGL